MKFEAAASAIAEAAAFAARHSPRIAAIPALAGLVLEAEESGGVTVTGYDVEATSTMTVPAVVSEPGLALLPGRPVAEILRTLPEGEATVVVDQATARITAAEIEFVLPVLPADDRARLPAAPPPVGRAGGAELTQAVGQVTAVTGRDVVPPILTAVRLELGPDRLRLAATDKYRIALREVPWTGPDEPVRALVPAHQLAATAAALDPAREWSLGVEAGTVLTMRDGRRTCTLRLIDGAYPPIESVVPESFAGAVQVERAALAEAIARVSLAGDEGGRGAVVLAGGPSGSLEVTGGSGSSRGRQRLPCRHSGPDVHAAFTASYLAGALAAIPQEQVRIRLDPGIGKVLVTAVEEVGYQHVLMSRRLPGE